MIHRLFQIITASMLLLSGVSLYAQDYKAPPVTLSKDKVKSQDGQICYSHYVLEKQTLYSICKAYGVTVEQVYAVNPGLKENGIKKNSFLLVPAVGKETEKDVAAPQEANGGETGKQVEVQEGDQVEDEFILHKVKWFEDIDEIALKYGVPADYILKINHLVGKKIKSRMKLKIPVHYVPEETDETTEIVENEVEMAEEDSMHLDLSWFNSKKNLEILLNLPFDAELHENKNAMDFYGGFLLGIKELNNNITDIDLNVYDCARNLPLTKEKVNDAQMIVGPISSSQLEKVSMMRTHGNCVLISPLDPRAGKLTATHPQMIQVPPRTEDQYRDLTAWIQEDLAPGERVLTIYETGSEKGSVARFNSIIRESGVKSQFFSYALLEGRSLVNRLEKQLSPEHTNRIVINSEKEAFVNDVIRNLNILLHMKYPIVVYCPSKIKSFETVDIENLHNLDTHMSSSYYTDYETAEARDFVLKYRALYNNEPTQYAFQGYDIATYFIGLYTRYGKKWTEHLTEEKISLLQVAFDFEQLENGSFINRGTRRFIYGPDWRISEVKRSEILIQ